MDKLNGSMKNTAVTSPHPKNTKRDHLGSTKEDTNVDNEKTCRKQIVKNPELEKTEGTEQNKTNPIRMVTSHGDTPMIKKEFGQFGKYLIRSSIWTNQIRHYSKRRNRTKV